MVGVVAVGRTPRVAGDRPGHLAELAVDAAGEVATHRRGSDHAGAGERDGDEREEGSEQPDPQRDPRGPPAYPVEQVRDARSAHDRGMRIT